MARLNGSGWSSLGTNASWADTSIRDVVDPETEMASWFVSGMSRAEVRELAVKMLNKDPPGSFLVRDVQSEPDCFGLSIKNQQGSLINYLIERVRHKKRKKEVKGYQLRGTSEVFQTLSTLIHFYAETFRPALGIQLKISEDDYTFDAHEPEDRGHRRGNIESEGSQADADSVGTTAASSIGFEYGRDGPPIVRTLNAHELDDSERWKTNRTLEREAYEKSVGRSAKKGRQRKAVPRMTKTPSSSSMEKSRRKKEKKEKKSKTTKPQRTSGPPPTSPPRAATLPSLAVASLPLDQMDEASRLAALEAQLALYRKETELAQARLRAAEATMRILGSARADGGAAQGISSEASTKPNLADHEAHILAAEIEAREQAAKAAEAEREAAAAADLAAQAEAEAAAAEKAAAEAEKQAAAERAAALLNDAEVEDAQSEELDLDEEEARYMRQAAMLASGAMFDDADEEEEDADSIKPSKRVSFQARPEDDSSDEEPTGFVGASSPVVKKRVGFADPEQDSNGGGVRFGNVETIPEQEPAFAREMSSEARELRSRAAREETERKRREEMKRQREQQSERWKQLQAEDAAKRASNLSLNSTGKPKKSKKDRPLKSALKGQKKKKKTRLSESTESLAKPRRKVSFADDGANTSFVPGLDIRIDQKAQQAELNKLQEMEAREMKRRAEFDEERRLKMNKLKGLTWKGARRNLEKIEAWEREEMKRRRQWDIRQEEREAKFLMNRPEASEQLEEYIRDLETRQRAEQEAQLKKKKETLGLVGEGKVGRLLQMFGQ